MVAIHGEYSFDALVLGGAVMDSSLSSSFFCLSFSFGYVVEGSDFLQDIKEGDVIVSAKVTDGLQYLKQP